MGSASELTIGSISQCTRDYAAALIDPWNMERPPCIPDFIVLPSYKVGFRARGTFAIGTNGVGFVTINPYAVANTGGGGATSVAGTYTDTTYTGTTYALFGATGVNQYINDSSFITGNVGPNGIQYRVVGCGLKCRYTGIEFNRGGRVIAYRNPTNQDAPGGATGSDFLNNRETQISPSDRKYHYVCFRPAIPTDVTYSGVINSGAAPMLLYIDGGAPGTSYEFDAIWWYECIGSLLPARSRSHSDPIGLAAVEATLPLMQPKGTPEAEHANFLESMVSYAKTAFSFLSPALTAIGGAENLLPIASALFL